MSLRFGVATLALLAGVSVVNAADLRVKARPAPVVPVSSWTGFYIGGSGGGIWTDESAGIAAGGNPGGISTPTQAAIARSLDLHSQSWIFGGDVGYNWQMGQWVYGLEADFSGTGLDPTGGVTNQAFFGNPNNPKFVTTSGEGKLDWLGTARARLGVLADPHMLFYVTGGFAYGHTRETVGVATSGGYAANGLFNLAATNSATSTGWAAGLGGEDEVAPDWTVRVEWLHYDLGSLSALLVRSPNNVPPPGFSASETYSFVGNIVRGGINHKF
jgi:outer membrane immunogenic protein